MHRCPGSLPIALPLAAFVLGAGLCAPGLFAQGQGAQGEQKSAPRLRDTIEAPLLYVALDGALDGALGGALEGARDDDRADGSHSSRAAVRRLLADPAFDTLLGAADSGNASTGRSLALVRGVLARSPGEIEIALTGVVPGVGQPLLVLRARLHGEQAAQLTKVLAGGGSGPQRENRLAANHRKLGGEQTYAMLGEGGELAEGAGQQVELALVGSDLVMTNDSMAMEELLDPDRRTSAARRGLSTDERFVDLERRIDAPTGSLLVYGDWARLSQRLAATAGAGFPALLLQWSGLGSANSVMAALCSDDDGDFTATVLLDFDRAALDRGARPARPLGRRAAPRPERWGSPGIDGWFAAALSISARKLVRDLPGGGLGGLVLAVDLRDIAGRSHRGAQLLRILRLSFEDFGLDFDRNVLSRLGDRGTVQLLFRRGDGKAATEIESVYSVRARSRTAAGDLFTDLRRAAEQNGMGRVVSGRERPGRNGVDVLELRRHSGDSPTCVAVHGDAVLVAFDAATIDAFLVEQRRAAKQRGKRTAAVSTVVQEIGGTDVTGLFDLDFTPWFDHFEQLLEGSKTAIDLSRIPRRHVGYLDLQPREGGTVIRICVLSSR